MREVAAVDCNASGSAVDPLFGILSAGGCRDGGNHDEHSGGNAAVLHFERQGCVFFGWGFKMMR